MRPTHEEMKTAAERAALRGFTFESCSTEESTEGTDPNTTGNSSSSESDQGSGDPEGDGGGEGDPGWIGGAGLGVGG